MTVLGDIMFGTHVICTGVEKCGTTSLFDFMQHAKNLHVPSIKETFYFSNQFQRGESWYTSLYSGKINEGKPKQGKVGFLDFTPSYFRHQVALDRIKAYPSKTKKILFCMRNPLQRAFSFYQHQIFHHIAKGEGIAQNFEKPVFYSFYDTLQRGNEFILTRYHDAYVRLLDMFGEENVLPVFFESIVKDTNSEITKIENFLEIDLSDLKEQSLPHSNANSLPSYFYADKDQTFIGEMGQFVVEGKTLHVFQNGTPKKLSVKNLEQVQNAFALQSTWTREVSKE